MLNKIKNNVWQFSFRQFGSCVYLIKLKNKNILIDTGSSDNKSELLDDLNKLKLKSENIGIILLTHSHYDHIGNIDLFKNAKVYGNKMDFKDKKILDINKIELNDIKILNTPGHTLGSICIIYKDMLFSGDTLFYNGYIGRTDFPESSPEQMEKSLKKLRKLNYKILCPGH